MKIPFFPTHQIHFVDLTWLCNNLCISRAGDSDVDSSDLDKRKRKDKDGESSKSKKKHKKHKKNKKAKKYDATDGKERIKKHKKHHKRSKSSDGSDSNAESGATIKTRCDITSSSRQILDTTKLPPQPPCTTLNTKFTEIMKSNGHVPKPLPKFNNGNGAESSSTSSKRDSVNKIPTDPSKLVEFITKSLDANTSTQVVSSASDSDTVNDVDSPDVAVIEDDEDLNLEELMRQKAFLQARLGGIPMSDTESENSHKTPAPSSVHKTVVVETKTNEKEKEKEKDKEKEKGKDKLKRRAEPVNDVILLDDSSNDASAEKPPPPPKKKVRSTRSTSRDRANKERNSSNSGRNIRDNRDGRDTRENDKSSKSRRSDVVENRFKEDLRREIDRDKERTHRQSSSAKPDTYSPSSKTKQPPPSLPSEKSKTQSSFREREVNDNQK